VSLSLSPIGDDLCVRDSGRSSSGGGVVATTTPSGFIARVSAIADDLVPARDHEVSTYYHWTPRSYSLKYVKIILYFTYRSGL